MLDAMTVVALLSSGGGATRQSGSRRQSPGCCCPSTSSHQGEWHARARRLSHIAEHWRRGGWMLTVAVCVLVRYLAVMPAPRTSNGPSRQLKIELCMLSAVSVKQQPQLSQRCTLTFTLNSLSLIHISSPRDGLLSRMPSSA